MVYKAYKAATFWRQNCSDSKTYSKAILIRFSMNPSPNPIDDFLSVCLNCGYTGEDHEKCSRCKMAFIYPPRRIRRPSDTAVHVSKAGLTSANSDTASKTNRKNRTPNKSGT